MVNYFEEVMSLPIFLVIVNEYMNLFYGFQQLDNTHKFAVTKTTKYHSFGILSMCLRSFVAFMSICLAASSVHDASKNAKNVQKEMLEKVIDSGNHTYRNQLLFLTYNSPAIKLSAWGFIFFTRGLILTALGSIIAYSLLVNQILV
ncbi:uncharacterized protein NPIL_82171 [Nephila pilipes]|uniref:Gustatory receptor n=1 Tax=Nephila pilipes TaxID=299642 RepID=A0A8X6R3T9_NEPPI|nr:uncharacterized protein NPIL_82171 [Nephila pilipes]